GTGNLEVHIAQVVFITQNVGQDGELVTFLHQPHGNTGHRCFQRYTGIHQRKAGTTHRRHGTGAVGFGDLGDRTDGIRELFHGGHNSHNTTLGQTAVADFTTTRRTNTPSFAYGIRREVVVEQERVLTL